MSGSLGLFGGRDRPDVASAWKLYEESERFNSAIDLYDTSLFTIDQVADWEWIEGETRQVLHQKPGYPTYTATVAKYCDLMCALPGGIARLNGVAAPAVKPVLIANAESQPVPTKAISA